MEMEVDYSTVLDIALGGPEVGPKNLATLHGLLHELFKKTGLSEQELIIQEEDPIFGGVYNFIKSKIDESKLTPRTAGGGYSVERSKVSVIVSDYARSPIGMQKGDEKPKTPTILPADIEDRLKFIESELKIVKNFPTVDELRSWASEKTSPDTIVTDLWHFVSLNHRMNGAEEGIEKLTELVDKLIPELKKLNDEQKKCQGQIDDIYSQFKALSDRTSRVDERIDAAGEKAEQKVKEILDELRQVEEKLNEYAKLSDLEDFVLCDTFIKEKDKSRLVADQINEELSTKAPMSMLTNLPRNSDLKVLTEDVNKIRDKLDGVAYKDDLSNLDFYVKWPQLEDALANTPGHKFPPSRPISGQSDGFSRRVLGHSAGGLRESPVQSIESPRFHRPVSGKSDGSGSRPTSGSRSNSRASRHGSRNSLTSMSEKQQLYQPSDNVLKRLGELGMLAERQKDLMDALERTREQLTLKADKTDLENLLSEESLNDLLNLIRKMKEEMNGLQSWRAVVDDEKVPALRDLLKELQQQTSTLLDTMSTLNEEDAKQQGSIDTILKYIDRLEDNKLERDDPTYLELVKNMSISRIERKENIGNDDTEAIVVKSVADVESNPITDNNMKDVHDGPGKIDQDKPMNGMDSSGNMRHLDENIRLLEDKLQNMDQGRVKEMLLALQNALKGLSEELMNHENSCKTEFADVSNALEEKLDRMELQPLREYLEHRYDILQQQQEMAEADKCPTTPPKRCNGTTTKLPTPPNKSRNNFKQQQQPYFEDMDQLPCSHPHYGNGFVPHKDAAMFKTQMKFNCLSCDRPLTMQSNSHFQTIRGRPLNAYELDQLRVLQKILKGEKASNPTRPCGGKHTKGSNKKANHASSSKSLPVMDDVYIYDEDFVDGEVDIEGIDGRLYKGLISQKDLKRHLRSKSANADLRTVSPRMKHYTKDRPISGKSVDFMSSFTSGLGTTKGSIDMRIDH